MAGTHHSAETRAKLSAAWQRNQQRGPKGTKWTGDNATYGAVHKRLGSVGDRECVDCGGLAQQWSLKPCVPVEHIKRDQARNGLRYSIHADDYEPRCARCHMHLDGTAGPDSQSHKTHCPQGHAYTPENIKPQKNGRGRQCRTCRRAGARRTYYADLEATRAKKRAEYRRLYAVGGPESWRTV